MTADAKMITKNDYADYINEHRGEFNFDNFKLIFDVICNIINDANLNGG